MIIRRSPCSKTDSRKALVNPGPRAEIVQWLSEQGVNKA
jgi:hypothetical protein